MPHKALKKLMLEPDKLEGISTEAIPTRRSEAVAHVIRKAIFSGALRAGESIRERNLADELQISRTPVREALFILQGEGLIELSHNRSARVANVTTNDIKQIYSLRQVLEVHSARCAAENRDLEKLARVEEALEKQIRLGTDASPLEQAKADLAFHEAIAAASGSQLLLTVVHEVLAVTVTHRSRYAYSATRIQAVFKQHQAILDAMVAGDPDHAELLMLAHVEQSSKLAVKHLRQADEKALEQGSSTEPVTTDGGEVLET